MLKERSLGRITNCALALALFTVTGCASNSQQVVSQFYPEIGPYPTTEFQELTRPFVIANYAPQVQVDYARADGTVLFFKNLPKKVPMLTVEAEGSSIDLYIKNRSLNTHATLIVPDDIPSPKWLIQIDQDILIQEVWCNSLGRAIMSKLNGDSWALYRDKYSRHNRLQLVSGKTASAVTVITTWHNAISYISVPASGFSDRSMLDEYFVTEMCHSCTVATSNKPSKELLAKLTNIDKQTFPIVILPEDFYNDVLTSTLGLQKVEKINSGG